MFVLNAFTVSHLHFMIFLSCSAHAQNWLTFDAHKMPFSWTKHGTRNTSRRNTSNNKIYMHRSSHIAQNSCNKHFPYFSSFFSSLSMARWHCLREGACVCVCLANVHEHGSAPQTNLSIVGYGTHTHHLRQCFCFDSSLRFFLFFFSITSTTQAMEQKHWKS